MQLTPVDYATFAQTYGLPYPSSSEERSRLAPAVSQWKAQQEQERREEILGTIGAGLLGAGALGALGYGGYRFLGLDKSGAEDQAAKAAATPTRQLSPREQLIADTTENVERLITSLTPGKGKAPWAGTLFAPTPKEGLPQPSARIIPASYEKLNRRTGQSETIAYGASNKSRGLPVSDRRGAEIAAPMRRRNEDYNILSQLNPTDLIASGNLGELQSTLEAMIANGEERRAAQLIADVASQYAINAGELKTSRGAYEGNFNPFSDVAQRASQFYTPTTAYGNIEKASALVNKYLLNEDGELEGIRPEPVSTRATDALGYEQGIQIIRDNEIGFEDYLSSLGARVDDQESIRMAIANQYADYVPLYQAAVANGGEVFFKQGEETKRFGLDTLERIMGPGGMNIFESIVLPRVQIERAEDGSIIKNLVAYNSNGEAINAGRIIDDKDELGRDYSYIRIDPDSDAPRLAVVPKLDLTDVIEDAKGYTQGLEPDMVEAPPSKLMALAPQGRDGDLSATLFPDLYLTTFGDSTRNTGTRKLLRITKRAGNDDFTEFLTPEEIGRMSWAQDPETGVRKLSKLYTGYEEALVDDLGRLYTVGPGQLDVLATQYHAAKAAGNVEEANRIKGALMGFANSYAQGELISNPGSRSAMKRAGKAAQTAGLNFVQPYVAEALDTAIEAFGTEAGLTMEGLVKESIRRLALPKALYEAGGKATVPLGLLEQFELEAAASDPLVKERILQKVGQFQDNVYDLEAAQILDAFDRGAVTDGDSVWGRNFNALKNYVTGPGSKVLYTRFSQPGGGEYSDPTVARILTDSSTSLSQKAQALSSLQGADGVNPEAIQAALRGIDARAGVVPFLAVSGAASQQARSLADEINNLYSNERVSRNQEALAEVGYAFENDGGESAVINEAIDRAADPMQRLIEEESEQRYYDDPRKVGVSYSRLRDGSSGTLPNAMREGFKSRVADQVFRPRQSARDRIVNQELGAMRPDNAPSASDILAREILARRQEAPPPQSSGSRNSAVQSAVEQAVREELKNRMELAIAAQAAAQSSASDQATNSLRQELLYRSRLR